MQRRIPHSEEQPVRRRFTRRIVKKQAFQEPNIKVVNVDYCHKQEGRAFVPIVRKAAGGGGGGPEPFCGAGGGPDAEEVFWTGRSAEVPTMDSEEEDLMFARANRQKTHNPYEALRALKVKALVTLDAARALASDAFMKAATAKNGTDYNRYMDESAVAGAEVQRLYNIVDDIEDRIMAMEFPGLFVA